MTDALSIRRWMQFCEKRQRGHLRRHQPRESSENLMFSELLFNSSSNRHVLCVHFRSPVGAAEKHSNGNAALPHLMQGLNEKVVQTA